MRAWFGRLRRVVADGHHRGGDLGHVADDAGDARADHLG
jgi:hypothetical protein